MKHLLYVGHITIYMTTNTTMFYERKDSVVNDYRHNTEDTK